jgi:hypothetical protein
MAITPNDIYSVLTFGINNDEEGIPRGRSFLGAVTLVTGTPIRMDFKPLVNLKRFSDIKSMFIDNSAGTTSVTLTILSMGNVIVPAGFQAICPIFMSDDNTITFSGNGTVNFALVNIDCHMGMWNPNGAGGTNSFGNNTDNQVPVSTGLVGGVSYNYGYDILTGEWSRQTIKSTAYSTSLVSADTINGLVVNSLIYGLNGTSGVPISARAAGGGDAQTPANPLDVWSLGQMFNGTNWDRVRNNIDTAALLNLAAQGAGTVNSSDQTNFNGRGVQVGINVTAATAMTLTIHIQGKDVASGQYYDMLVSTAIAATGFTRLTLYPGMTNAANVMQNDVLPRTWRVQAVVTGTSVSATVGASVIL